MSSGRTAITVFPLAEWVSIGIVEIRNLYNVAAMDNTIQQIDLGVADKIRNKQIGREVIDAIWGRHLLNNAQFHHSNIGGHRQSFDLVMRDIDGSSA